MIFIEHQKFFEEVKKHHKEYKLMALDVGQKKIGLATVFSSLKVVTPYKILIRKTLNEDLSAFTQEIRENSISALLIGLPMDNQGNSNNNTQLVLDLAQKIEEKIDIPITFIDERMTTKLANTLLKEINLSRKMRNKIDDQIAASIILDDFLKLNHKYL